MLVSRRRWSRTKPAQIPFSYEGQFTGTEDSPVYGITFAELKPDFGFLLYPSRWFPVNGYTVNRFKADLRITALRLQDHRQR